MELTFSLKKLISEFLYPLPLTLLLILIGLVLLRKPENRMSARRWLTGGVFLLILFSVRPLTNIAVDSLEGEFKPYTTQLDVDVKYVAVLAGGYNYSPGKPHTQQLGLVTMARLLEGMRIAAIHPNAHLILSGGQFYDMPSMAVLMKYAAEDLGFDASRIILEDRSLDTEQQAEFIRNIVQDEPTVVVTSATHMRRSLGLFRYQNVDALSGACDFKSNSGTGGPWYSFIPNSSELVIWRSVIHEYVGMAWSKLRGRFASLSLGH